METSTNKQNLLWLILFGMPFIIFALFALAMGLHRLGRYDARYFSPEYRELYSAPGLTAVAFEQVLRSGDAQQYAELTALRSPLEELEPKPELFLTILLEVDAAEYFHYMYFDQEDFHRYTYYIKEVNGRYVVSPEDAYYYLDSGEWKTVAYPLSIFWWMLLLVFTFGRYLFGLGAKFRNEMGR